MESYPYTRNGIEGGAMARISRSRLSKHLQVRDAPRRVGTEKFPVCGHVMLRPSYPSAVPLRLSRITIDLSMYFIMRMAATKQLVINNSYFIVPGRNVEYGTDLHYLACRFDAMNHFEY